MEKRIHGAHFSAAPLCRHGAVLSGLKAAPAASQTEDCYRGRALNIYIGPSEDSGLELYPRLLAEYLTRFISGNPNAVIRYLLGVGGVKAAKLERGATQDQPIQRTSA